MIQVHKYLTPFEQLWIKGVKFHRVQKRKKMFLNDGTLVLDNKRFVKRSYKINDIYGFDTETFKGKCKLICRSDGTSKQLLEPSFLECLNFLFYNAKSSHIWRFFYNIDFDYNAIIKTLNLNNAFAKILIIMLNRGLEVQFNKYKITYIKNIMLKIRKGHKTVVFTDLFRVFRMSLNSASIEFLKNEVKENIDGNMLNTSIEYWNKNLNAIISYCIQDCMLLKKLGLIFLEHLKEANITIPRYLCSPASLSKAHFRKKCHIPNLLINSNEIIQIAYDCYYGGRFELLKRGTFEKMYNYDVNSEYPEIIAKLPSFKYGLWKRHNEIKELPVKECFGYFKVKILVPDDNLISTLPIRYKGLIRFPNGIFEKWFTWYDLDLLREYIIEIIDAYIYESSKNDYFPFRNIINDLYKKKAKFKNVNKIMYMIFKLTMNALYGCFFEIHKREFDNSNIKSVGGILFNPIYASIITSFGRWKILKDVWTVKDKLIGFHTDSILSTIPLEKYLDIGTKLGQWSNETSKMTNIKGYIINTGMYQIGTIEKEKIIKTRGIPRDYIIDWFEFAENNKFEQIKEFKINRMTKLAQSLIQYKDLNMINIMKDNKKTVNINSDKKRHWFEKFKNFEHTLNDNIDSLPYIYCFDKLLPNPLLC